MNILQWLHSTATVVWGSWKCTYKGCKTECPGKNPEKSLRKHVRNQHLNEYLYWCKYCTTYGKDQRHLVINHMLSVHGIGQQLPWGNIGCNKLFPSMQSLKEHEQFCREGKKYTCDFFFIECIRESRTWSLTSKACTWQLVRENFCVQLCAHAFQCTLLHVPLYTS